MQDPHVGARGVTGKVGLNGTRGGGYQQPTYAPGASYAPKISMGRPATAAPIMRGGSQNYTIKAAANGDYINNFASGDIVCNQEFFTMTEDRPIVKEVCPLPCPAVLALPHVRSVGCLSERKYFSSLQLLHAFSADDMCHKAPRLHIVQDSPIPASFMCAAVVFC